MAEAPAFPIMPDSDRVILSSKEWTTPMMALLLVLFSIGSLAIAADPPPPTPPPSTVELLHELEAKDLARLQAATEAVVNRGALAVPDVTAQLANEHALPVRLTLCTILARMRGNAAEAVPALAAAIEADRGPTRVVAARAMQWILSDHPGGEPPPPWDGHGLVAALLADLAHPDSTVRDTAARTAAILAPLLDHETIEPLIPALITLTEDPTVQTHRGTYAFIPAITRRPVAEAAAWALEQIDLEEPRIATCLAAFYGRSLFDAIDLTRPELHDVAAAVAAANYGAALRAYRPLLLARFARLDFGEPWDWGRAGDPKLLLSHHHKAVQYAAKTGATRYVGAPGAMDWYIDEPQNNCWPEFTHRMTWTGYLLKSSEPNGFARTGNPACLQLWLNAFSDFDSTIFHHYALAEMRYRTIGIGNVWWGHNGGVFGWLLQQAFRLEARLNGLSLAARTHPATTRTVISEILLAKFLLATVRDVDYIVPWLTNPHVVADTHVPANQLMHGVNAVTKSCLALPDFTKAATWSTGITAFVDLIPMYPDGTELEQAFWYNGGVIDFARKFAEAAPSNENAQRLKHMALFSMRFLACIARPHDGQTPGEAKSMKKIALPAGYDDPLTTLITQRLAANCGAQPATGTQPPGREVTASDRATAGTAATSAPVFDSVLFPYSGYAILRNGWDRDAIHLYLKGGRKGTGHSARTSNQIQLTAWGRTLLTRGGSGLYGPPPFPGYDTYIDSCFGHCTVAVDGCSQANPKMPLQTTPIPCRWITSPAIDVAEGLHDAGYEGVTDPVTHERLLVFFKKAGIFLVRDRMNAAEEHTYAQVWCLGKEFTPAHVSTDESTSSIRTRDPSGPNLEIYHVGGASVTYSTHCAETTPGARGWRDKEFPAVDVHARWRAGASHLLTLLCPAGPAGSQVLSVNHRTQDGVAAFTLCRTDGSIIEGCSSLTAPRPLTIGTWTATADLLLAYRDADGTRYGLVFGATEFQQDGHRCPLPSNAIFTERQQQLTDIAEIGIPTGFSWHEAGTKSAPIYTPNPTLPTTR